MTTPAVRTWTQIAVFRTLLLSHAEVTDAVRKTLAEHCALSMMEFDMIAELGGHDGMRMSDLSLKMITSPSSVTRVAKALEKKGFVKRRRSEVSEREVLAELTDEGRAFFEANFEQVAAKIAEFIDARLSAEEQDQLVATLAKLTTPR